MSSHPANPEQDAAEGGRGGKNPVVLDILKPRTMMGLLEDAPEEQAPDDRLRELLPRQGGVVAAAEKEELPHVPPLLSPPHTQQQIVSPEHKISGHLQWSIPHQHPALATTASAAAGVVVGAGNMKNQGTVIDHQRHYLPDSSPFFDLAHERRGLLERNWETMGANINGDVVGDLFGSRVSMSADGMRVAIGAMNNDGADGGQQNAGQVRVFQYNVVSSTWTQLGEDFYGPTQSQMGKGLSISGDGKRVAIGAPGLNAGKVNVYEYDDSSDLWRELGTGSLNAVGTGDHFSPALSLTHDGKRVAIGAPHYNSQTGYAQVFEYNEGTQLWVKLGQDIPAEAAADEMGQSVSLSRNGDRIAVGSGRNGGAANLAGNVRVFEYNSTDWVQLGNDIDGEGENDYSGFRTSLSDAGHRVAIGARFNDPDATRVNAGHVRVFEYNEETKMWDKMGDDFDGLATEDRNGASVSLSADGSQVAIGAEKSSSERGYVRVFQYRGSTWQQIGQQITGEMDNVWCGTAVSMSESGDRLAVGCPGVYSRNEIPGHVRIFELPALPSIFDLAVSLDSVEISLTNNTDFSEAIVFQYSYTGNTRGEDPRLRFTYDIRKGDCETPFAPHGNKSMALYFNDFDDETIDNKVIAKLGINLTTIEGAQDVWTQDNGETQATLKFCAVWNILVEDVLFQFHESNVTATINLKEDGGFTVNELDVGLDRQDANALAEDVEVQFPLDVFICDDNADTTDLPSGGFTQGDVIQVCIMVKNTTTADVYVEGIDKMMYSATEVNTTMTLIDNGNLNYGSTAAFDCSHDGICSVKFVAMAGMYVNTPNNILYTEGFATIAFGSDPDARHRRRMAFTGHSESMRRIQENGAAAAAAELAPFEFAVGNLQPSSSSGLESVGGTEHFGIVISVVLGIAVVIIAAVVAAAFFVYRRRTSLMMMQPAVAAAEGLEKDEREDDGSSSQLAETNESDDSYEIVEV